MQKNTARCFGSTTRLGLISIAMISLVLSLTSQIAQAAEEKLSEAAKKILTAQIQFVPDLQPALDKITNRTSMRTNPPI